MSHLFVRSNQPSHAVVVSGTALRATGVTVVVGEGARSQWQVDNYFEVLTFVESGHSAVLL